ncbi:hypothetical protein BJY00DRAFT_93539 [Aspergillus carlsbadensis]|nr:hypothetical protein BJY00DRAFT_93539 [Aspergillus carlsbadensis]
MVNLVRHGFLDGIAGEYSTEQGNQVSRAASQYFFHLWSERPSPSGATRGWRKLRLQALRLEIQQYRLRSLFLLLTGSIIQLCSATHYCAKYAFFKRPLAH